MKQLIKTLLMTASSFHTCVYNPQWASVVLVPILPPSKGRPLQGPLQGQWFRLQQYEQYAGGESVMIKYDRKRSLWGFICRLYSLCFLLRVVNERIQYYVYVKINQVKDCLDGYSAVGRLRKPRLIKISLGLRSGVLQSSIF